MHGFLSVALATAIIALPSCDNFTDCSTRRDCPSDFASDAGSSSASGASGKGGAASGSGGASGTAGGGSGTSGDGGTEATAGSGGAPPPACDGSLGPDADACVISDEYGVFVTPAGDDASADGTQAHPYATVTSALASIGKIKRVYVCAGEYIEPATLEIPDRVSIYGKFTCDGGTWKYDADTPAYLRPAYAIGAMITDAKVGVLIQDLRLDAANAAEDDTGASSFGLVIRGSQNVVLKRVEIRAGKGGKGKAGTDGATGLDGIASGSDQNGKAGSCTNPPGTQMGPSPLPRICGSEGGAGGQARVATNYAPSQDGGSGYLVSPSNGGKGGQSLGNAASRGGDVTDKPSPGDAGTSAPTVGAFSANGYKVASGGSGGAGKPGQAVVAVVQVSEARPASAPLVGQAAWEAAGVIRAAGGIGGGASVALLSWQSAVSIECLHTDAQTSAALAETEEKGTLVERESRAVPEGQQTDQHRRQRWRRGRRWQWWQRWQWRGRNRGSLDCVGLRRNSPSTRLAASILNFAAVAAVGGMAENSDQRQTTDRTARRASTQDIYPKQ